MSVAGCPKLQLLSAAQCANVVCNVRKRLKCARKLKNLFPKMEEGEVQEPEHVTTEELINLIGNVDAIHEELKEIEMLKYRLKSAKKIIKLSNGKSEYYHDLLRKSNAELYEIKNSKVTLDQHNILLKQLDELRSENHNLINSSEIRYQKVNQQIETVTKKNEALMKHNEELTERLKKGLQTPKTSQLKPKKNKEAKLELDQENVVEESQKIDLQELLSKLSSLQERHNEIIALNDELQNKEVENNNKHQKTITNLTEELKNKNLEIQKLQEINFSKTEPSLPMLSNDDDNKTKEEQEPEMSQKLTELTKIIKIERDKIKELTELRNLQQQEIKVLNDKFENKLKENIQHLKTVDILSSQLKNKGAELEKVVEELTSLQLQINLSKEDTVFINNSSMETENYINLSISNERENYNHPQSDHDEVSDPSTDDINSILTEMKQPNILLSPLSMESDPETNQNKIKNTSLIKKKLFPLGITQIKPSLPRLNREVRVKTKELILIKRKLIRSMKKLMIAKRKCSLKNKKLVNTKQEIRVAKKMLRRMEYRISLKNLNPEPIKIYLEQGTQCSPPEEPLPSTTHLPLPEELTKTQKKAFVEQLKIKKGIQQQLLDDIRKWHTDSFLSYPSDESDIESEQSQSSGKKKKYTKQRRKKSIKVSSDEEDNNVGKEKTKKDLIIDREPDQGNDSSETIYAKAQGSVDSGYVKTDSGGESDIENRKRKGSLNLNEISKKRKCINPENPADVKHWTRDMVQLFGTDSESHSPSGLEKKIKYLQRVENEKSNQSSDSDVLIGFSNGCYSSLPKKTASTSTSTPRSPKKHRKQPQDTPSKTLDLDLIHNDLILSSDYSTSSDTDSKIRNPLLDDGTQTLTCRVISNKSPLSTKRTPKKNKTCIQSPSQMVLRSGTRKTDDESEKSSSSECSTKQKKRIFRRTDSDYTPFKQAKNENRTRESYQLRKRKVSPDMNKINHPGRNVSLNLNLKNPENVRVHCNNVHPEDYCEELNIPNGKKRRVSHRIAEKTEPNDFISIGEHSENKRTNRVSTGKDNRNLNTENKSVTEDKNCLTNQQLLVRKKPVEIVNRTISNKTNEQLTFKKPNSRKAKLTLPNPDSISHSVSQNVNDIELKSLERTEAHPTKEHILCNSEKIASSKSRNLENFESPASPGLPQCVPFDDFQPITIPLEVQNDTSFHDLDIGRVKNVLKQLLHYCKSSEMAEAVTGALLTENPDFIAKLVLETISQDIHAKIQSFNLRRAPLLTDTQRLMLGLLLDLEEKGLKGVIQIFLNLSEQYLVTLKEPLHISPVARLHAAICKLQFDYKRMRLMICKAIFFMGDYAVPYLYIILCSWLELIPLNKDNLSGQDSLEIRTLVQIIRLKQCTDPQFNLHNLQTLLAKYYGYSFDREDNQKLLEELIKCYIEKPPKIPEDVRSESVMYLMLTLCESLDKVFVFKQLDKLKVRLVITAKDDEIYRIIYLMGIITAQYGNDKDDENVISNKDWLRQFCVDSYPEYIMNAARDVLKKL